MDRSLCAGSRAGRGDSDSMASIAGRMNESPVRLAGRPAGDDAADPSPGDGSAEPGGTSSAAPSRGAPGCCGLHAPELDAKRLAGESELNRSGLRDWGGAPPAGEGAA